VSDEVRKARIVFEVDRTKLDPALASISSAIAGVGGKSAAKLAQAFQAASTAAAKTSEAVQRTGQATEHVATKQRTAAQQAAAAAREEAKARADAAKAAKAATDAQVAGLKAEAAALREQQQVLKAIGGDAKQLHDLRMRELAILERAAAVAGKGSQVQGFRSAQTVERARMGEVNERARSAAFGEAGSGAAQAGGQVRGLVEQLKAASGPAASLASSLGQMGLAAVGIGAVGGALGMVVQAVDQISAESLKAQRVSAGLQFSIEGAAKAFGGYVDNVSLAQSANKAYAMGVVQTSAQFEKLAKGVNAIALRFGEDATTLLDNAVTAIGRQSRLILDNLGIILDNAKAEQIYAESLGKTTAQLTAYEKEIAFSQAAMILISEAGDEAGIAIDGMAAKAQKAKVALENYKQGVFGFTDQVGKTREALRALTDEELEQLGYGYAAAIDGSTKAGRAFDTMLDDAGAVSRWADEHRKKVEDLTAAEIEHAKAMYSTGVGLVDIKRLAEELGITYDELLAQEAKRREIEGDKQDKKEQDAETRAQIKALRDEADELEHTVELLGIAGMKQSETADIALEALRVRQQAAEFEYQLTGEIESQNEALKIQRQIDIMRAKDAAGKLDKKSGKGSTGPTEADRIKAEGQARTQAMAAELEQAQAIAQAFGSTEREAVALAQQRLRLTMSELDLQQRVLEATKAKNSVERQTIANELAQVERQRQQAQLEFQLEQRDREIAISRARKDALVEAGDAERAQIYDLAAYRNSVAAEEAKMQETRALRATMSLDRKAAIEDTTARKLHALKLKQITEERDARLAEIDARRKALESSIPGSGDPNDPEWIARLSEIKQTEHDREMARLQSDLEMRKAVASEQERIAAASEATLMRQLALVNQAIGMIEQAHGQLSGIVSDYRSRQRTADAADFEAWKQAQETKLKTQQDALEREKAAAKGNASAIAEINRRKAAAERTTQEKIRKAQAEHDRRIEEESMRSEGIKLMIQGAVSTVRAAAAYPNIPEMIAHAAAAAMAFAYGGMLLSGNVPRAKGAGAGSLSGAGGSLGTSQADSTSSEAARTPDSVPMADRDRFRTSSAASKSGSTVVVELHSLGKIGPAEIEAIGKAVEQANYQREGSARK